MARKLPVTGYQLSVGKIVLIVAILATGNWQLTTQNCYAEGLTGAIYDPTMQALEEEMKVSILKQQIIAHNLANKDTPGYVPVRFEEELQEIMSRPDYVKDTIIAEEEMAKMTKNRFRHQALLRLLNMKLDTVKKVINQGKG